MSVAVANDNTAEYVCFASIPAAAAAAAAGGAWASACGGGGSPGRKACCRGWTGGSACFLSACSRAHGSCGGCSREESATTPCTTAALRAWHDPSCLPFCSCCFCSCCFCGWHAACRHSSCCSTPSFCHGSFAPALWWLPWSPLIMTPNTTSLQASCALPPALFPVPSSLADSSRRPIATLPQTLCKCKTASSTAPSTASSTASFSGAGACANVSCARGSASVCVAVCTECTAVAEGTRCTAPWPILYGVDAQEAAAAVCAHQHSQTSAASNFICEYKYTTDFSGCVRLELRQHVREWKEAEHPRGKRVGWEMGGVWDC